MTLTLTADSPLDATHRCDRCGAQAYVQVELNAGGELLFCGHHAREHMPKLRPIALTVRDFTHMLDAEPTA